MRNKTLLYIVCMLIVIGGFSSAFGQIRYGQNTAGQLKFTYSHWKIENGDTATTIDQMSFPVSGFLPLKDNLEMHLFFAGATNNINNNNNDISLSGLGDMRLQVNQSLSDDQWLVSAGLNLPTGKKSLDPDGRQILSALSENYLSFPVRRLGRGLGFNVLLGTARASSSGNTRYGGGIMYQFNGTYEPYEGTGDYNPGDMISANAGVDISSGPTTVSIDAIYSLFAEDKVNDNKVFCQSPLLDLRLGVLRKMGSSSASLRLRYAMRGENKRYGGDNNEEISSLQLFGNEFLLAGNASFAVSESLYLIPLAELRLISENEQDFGNASIVGFGSNLDYKLGQQTKLTFGGKLYTGSADGGNFDLSGIQLTAGLKASF
ncbi:MAG: hypothetical protein U9N55_05340 [candidate division Zixibacteria bacterium]|nr:hypothetical protein [candidate division Zixibacteria bacterium]